MNQSHVRDRQMALRKSFCCFKIHRYPHLRGYYIYMRQQGDYGMQLALDEALTLSDLRMQGSYIDLRF